MAQHTNEYIISQIQLPGSDIKYDIHDASAIHDITDLELASVLVFKGTKEKYEDLPVDGNKLGDVYLIGKMEYVWAGEGKGPNADGWEPLGNVHDAASSTHKHNITVLGANEESEVTGTVSVPSITNTTKYLYVTPTGGSSTTIDVLGTGATFTTSIVPGTKKIKATSQDTQVELNTTSAIASVSAATTGNALGSETTFQVTGGTQTKKYLATTQIIPTVSTTSNAKTVTDGGNVTDGSAASWSANVQNGVLSFTWAQNTPTRVTLPTFADSDATKTSAGAAVTVATGLSDDNSAEYAEVLVGVAPFNVAASQDKLVTAITDISTTQVTVANGVKNITNPTIVLADATEAETNGVVQVLNGISSATTTIANADTKTPLATYAAPTYSLQSSTTDGTGYIDVSKVGVGTTTAPLQNGKAAAQTWKTTSITVGAPTDGALNGGNKPEMGGNPA